MTVTMTPLQDHRDTTELVLHLLWTYLIGYAAVMGATVLPEAREPGSP